MTVNVKAGKGVLPLPEAVLSFRQDVGNIEQWSVNVIRDATSSSANLIEREMNVSSLRDEVSRLYRARETVRVRIGLTELKQYENIAAAVPNVTSVAAAEELRITYVTGKLGYDIGLMKSGVEKNLGERMARDGTGNGWQQAVLYGATMAGTKAFNSFLAGVRSVNREWADALRKMSDSLTGLLSDESLHSLTNTRLTDAWVYDSVKEDGEYVSMPYGFHVNFQLADVINKYLNSGSTETEADGNVKKPRVPDKFPGEEGSGGFAKLIVNFPKLDEGVSGYLNPQRRVSYTGKSVRHPERLLTDPFKRVFSRKVPSNGGVILIDASGSMHLEESDMEQILKAAPGALVMVYSHSPDSVDVPNLHVLADRGRRVKSIREVPYRNGGNGVDGPALSYAQSLRRSGEPLIWVCDGQVTDRHDNSKHELTRAVAEFVVKYKVTQAPDVLAAIDMLKSRRFESKYDGFVGHYIMRYLSGGRR